MWQFIYQFDGLEQDCSNSIANALELLQSCIKPSNDMKKKLFYCAAIYCQCEGLDVNI